VATDKGDFCGQCLAALRNSTYDAMKRSVFGILKTRNEAETALERLKTAGFSNNDISILFPDTTGTRDFAHEHATKAPEGAATGGTTGFVVGGVLGWLAGIGSLAIPGIGPFIAAGPIMAALSGAAIGAAVGGIAGSLVGMGIPEYEARRYEAKIKEGNILVSVHVEDGAEVDHAKEILRSAQAEDIATSGESAVAGVRRETAGAGRPQTEASIGQPPPPRTTQPGGAGGTGASPTQGGEPGSATKRRSVEPGSENPIP
jgi:hypothetical protein